MRAYFSVLFGDISAPKESFSGYDQYCLSGSQDDVLYTLNMATSIALGSPAILARSNVSSFLGWCICEDKEKSVEVTIKKCSVHDNTFLNNTAGDSRDEIEVVIYINLEGKIVDAELIAPEEIHPNCIEGVLGTISGYRRINR